MTVIPLECPECGVEIVTDSNDSAAICSYCGKPFIVKDAIVLNYIKLVSGNVAGNSPGSGSGSNAGNNTGNFSGDNAYSNSGAKSLSADEFVIDNGVLKRYNGGASVVIIPDNVRAIGRKAFADHREITEVRLSDTVEIIEDNAFAGCDNLQTVFFAGSLKKIGSYAFSECSCLMSAGLPDSVEEIDRYAFNGCYMLGPVKMPTSAAKVHETAFMGCKDVHFEWPEDWKNRQLDKLRIVAPTLDGMIDLHGTGSSNKADGSDTKDGAGGTIRASDAVSDAILFMGISDLGMSCRYNFYTYHGFMNLFSLEKNNGDPYALRVSVEGAQQKYEAISDIQRSYSDLIGLLDRADISRDIVEMINIPHFIWKQGKRLNDYKVMDVGLVPALQIRLIRE